MFASRTKQTGLLAVLMVALMVFTAFVPMVNASAGSDIPPESDGSVLVPPFEDEGDTPTQADISGYTLAELLELYDVDSKLRGYFEGTAFESLIDYIDLYSILENLGLSDVTVGELSDGEKIKEILSGLDFNKILDILNVNTFLAENSLADVLEKFVDIDAVLENLGITSVTKEDVLTYLERFSLYDLVYDFGLDTFLTAIGLDKYVPGTIEVLTKDRFKYTLDYFETDLGESTLTITNLSIDIDATQGWDSATTVVKVDSVGLSGEAYQASVESVLLDSGSEVTSFSVEKFTVTSDGSSLVIDGILNGISVDNGVFTFMRVGDISVYDGEDKVFGLLPVKSSLYLAPFGPAALDDGDEEDVGPLAEFTLAFEGFEFGTVFVKDVEFSMAITDAPSPLIDFKVGEIKVGDLVTVKGFDYNSASDDKVTVSSLTLLGLPISLDRAFTEKGVTYDLDGLQIEIDGEIYSLDVLISTSGKDGVKNFHVEISSVTNIETKVCILDSFVFDMKSGSDLVVFAEVNGLEFDDTKVDHFKATFSDVDGKRSFDLEYTDVVFTVGSVKFELTPTSLSFSAPEYGMCGSISDDDGVYEIRVGLGSGNLDDCNVRFMTSSSGYIELLINELAVGDLVLDEATLFWDDNKFSFAFEKLVSEYVSISKFAIGKDEIFKALVESVEVGDEFVAEDVLFVAAESVSFTSAYFRIRDVEIDDFRVGSSEGKMIFHVGSVLRGPEDARTIDIEGLEITSEPSFVCDVFIVNDDDVKVSITKSAVDVTLFGVSVHYGFEDGSFTVSGDLEFEGFSIKDISVTRYVDVQIEFTFVSETISFEVDITIGSGAVQIGVANVDYTGGSVTLNIDSVMFKLGDEDGFVVGLIVGDVKYTSVDGYYTTTVTIDNRDSLCSGISYHSGADGKDLRVGFGYLTYSVSVMGSSSSVYYPSFTAIIGTTGIQFTLFGLDDSGFEVMYVSKEKFTLTGTSETLGFGIERDGTRISASVFTYTVVESEKVLDKHLEIKVEDGSLSYLCIDVFIGGTIVRADLNDGVLEIGCINGESELDAHFKNGDMFTVDIAAHIPAMEFECSVGIAIVKDFASNSEGAVAVEILISIYDSSVHFTYDNGKFDIVANYGEEASLEAVYDGTLTVIIIISPAMFEGEIAVAFEDGVFTVSTESFGRETEGRAFLVTDATASFDGKTFKDTIGSYTHVIDGENYGIAIELENYCIEISSDVFNESVDVCSIVFGYEDVTVECDLDTLCIATDRLVLEAVLGDDIVATLSIDGDKVLDAVVGKDKFSVVGHYESDDYYLDADLNLVDGAYAGHMEFSSEIAEIEMVVEDGAIIFDDTVVTPFGILKDNGKIVDNVLVEYTVGFECIDNHIVLSYQKDGPKTTDIDWTFSNGVKVVQELSVAPAGGQGATTVTYGDLVLNGRSMFTTQLDTMEIEIDQGENCAVFTYQNDGPKTTDIDWIFSNGVKVVQEFSIAPVGGQGSTTVTYGEVSCHTETVFTEQLDSMVVAVVYGDNHVKLAYIRDGEKTSDIDWTFSNGLSLRSNVTIGTDSGCGETNVVAGELSIHTETTYSEGVYTHASSFVRGSDHAVVNYRTGGDNSADIDWTFSNGIHLVQDMRNSPSGGQGSTTVTCGDFVLNSRSTFTTQLDTLNVEVTYGENDVSVEYAEGACCAQVTVGDLEVYAEVLSTDGKVSSVQIEITKGNVGAIAKVNETERVVAFAFNAEGQSFLVLFGKSDGKYMFEVEYADTVNRGFVSVFGETFLVDVDFTYGDFSVTAVAGNKDTFTMDVAISDKAFTLSASASEGKIELTSAFVYNERSLGVGLVYDGSIESMEFSFLGTDNHAIATYSKGVYSADVLFTYGTFNIEVAASGKDGSVDAFAIIGYMGRTVTAGVVYADGVQAYEFKFDGSDNHAYAVYKDGVGSFDVLFTYGTFYVKVLMAGNDEFVDVSAETEIEGRTLSAAVLYADGVQAYEFKFDGTDNHAYAVYKDGVGSFDILFTYGTFYVKVLVSANDEFVDVFAETEIEGRTVTAGIAHADGLQAYEFKFDGTDNHAYAAYKDGVGSADVLFTYGPLCIEVTASGNGGSADVDAVVKLLGRTATAGVVYENGDLEYEFAFEGTDNHAYAVYKDGVGTFDVLFTYGTFYVKALVSGSEDQIGVVVESEIEGRAVSGRVIYADGLQTFEFNFEGTDNHAYAVYKDGVGSADILFTYGAFSVNVVASGNDGSADVDVIVGLSGRTVTACIVYADGVQAYEFKFDGTDNHAYAVYKDGVGSFDILFTYGTFYAKVVVSANDEFVDVFAETEIEGRTVTVAVLYADGLQTFEFDFEGTDNHAYAVYKDGVGSADVLFTYGPLSIEVTASIDDGSADVDAVVKLLGRTAIAYAVYENGIKSFGFSFDGTDNYAKFEYDDGTYSGKFYFAYGPFSVSATVDGHDAVLIAKLSEYSAVLMLKDGSVALSALKNVDVLASMVYGNGLELLTIDLEKGSNKVFVFYKEALEADVHLSYSDYLVEADVHESNGTFYVAIGESSAKIEHIDGVYTVTITTVVGGEKLVTVTVFEGAITELDIDLESEINKFQVRYEKGSFSADVHFVMSDGEFDLESTIDDSVKCVDVLYDSSDRFIRNRVVYTDGLQEYVLEFEGVVNSFVVKYSDSDRCVKGHFEYGAFSVDADVDYDGEALSVEGKVGLEGRTVSAALTYTDSVQAYDFRFDGTDNHAYAVYKDGVGSFDVLFTYGAFYVKAVVSANDEFVDVSAETRIEGRTISAALTYADGVQAYDFRFDGTDNHAYAVYKDGMGTFDILFTYGPFSANLVVSGKEGYADVDAIVKLSGRTASVCVVYENGIESFELGFEGTDNHAFVSFNDGKGDFDVLFTYGEFAINAVAAVKDGCVDASVHVDIKGRLVAVAVTYADGVQAFDLEFDGTDNHAYVAYADSLFDVDILFTYGEFGFVVASKENLSYILVGANAPGFSVLFDKDEAAVEIVFTMELDGVTATLKAEFDENGFDKCFASVMNDGLILIAEFEIDEVPSYEILMMIFGDYITGIMLAKDKDGISCSASVLSDKVYVGCGITYSGYIQEIYVNLEVTDNYVYYDYKDGVSLFDVELTYGPCSIDVTNEDGELMAKVVYNGPGFTVQAHMVDQVSGVILSVDLDGVECDLSVNFDEHGFSDAEIAVETEDVTATFSVEMGETVEYTVTLEIEKEYGIVATFVKNGSGTTFTCEASYEDVTAEVHLFNFEGNVSVTVGSDTEATLVLKKENVDISIVVGTNYFKTYLGEDFQSVEVYFVVEEFEFRFGANNEKEPVLHMGVDYNGSNIANVTYEDGKFVAKALFKNDDLSVDIDIELPEPVMVSIDVVRSDNHYVKVEVSDTVDVDVDWSVMGVTVLAQVFTGESGLEGVVEIGSSEFTFFAEIEGDIFSVEFVYGYVALDVVSGYDSEVYTVCVELTVGLFKASGIYTADSTVLTAGYDDGTTVFEMEIVLDKAISLDISLVSGDNKCLVKADNGSGNIDIDWTVETVTVKLVDSIIGADSVGRLNIDAENVAFVLAFDRGDIRSTLDCLYSEFGLCASLTLSDETNGCSVTLVRGEDHAAMEYTDGVFIEDTVWKFENVKLEVDAEIGGESSTVCIVFENDVFKADLDYVDTTYKVVFTLTTDDYNVDFGLIVSDEEKKADLTVINHENSLVAKYLDAAVSVDVDWVIDEAKVTVDFEYDETVDGKISIDSDISHLGAVFDDSKVSFDLECPVRMYDLTLTVVVSDSLDLLSLDVKADEKGVSVKYGGTAVEFDVSDTIGKTDVDGTVTYDGTVCYFDIEVSSEYFYLKAESNETFTCVKLIVDSVFETFDIDADDALLTIEYYSDESTTKLIITVNTGCADMAVSIIDGKVGVDIDATVCEVEIHVDATATEDDMVAYVEVSKQGNVAVMSYNEGNVKANLSYTVEELEIRAEYTYDGAHSASLYIQNGSDTCQIGYADKKYTIVLEETLLDSVHVSMDLSATTVLEEVNFSIASEGGELQFGYGDDGVNMTFEMSVEPLEMSVNVNIGDDTIVLVNCDYGENHFDLMFNEVLDINVNFETEDIVLNASVEYGGTEDSANISFTYGEYRFTMEYDEVEDFMDVFFTNGIYAIDVNVGDEIIISVAHERFALAVYYAFDNGAVGVVFETVGFTAGAAYKEGQFTLDLGYDYDGIFAEFSMNIGEGYAVGLTAGADSDRITVQVSDKGAFAQIDVTVYGFGVVAYLDTIDDSFKCSLEVKVDEYFVKLAYANGIVIVGVNVVIETVAIDATVVVDKDVEFDIAVSNDNGLVKAKFDNEKTAVSFDIDRDGYDIVSDIVVTEDGTTLSFELLKGECSLGISVLGGIIDVAVEVKTDDVQAKAEITNENVFTVNAEVVGYNSKFELDVTPGDGYLGISTATDEFSCSIAVIYDGVHTVIITVGCGSGTCSVKISEDGTIVISKDDGTSASEVVIEGVDIDLDEKTFVADKVVVTVDGEDVVVVDKVEVTVKDSGIDASAESIEATVSETEIKTSVSGSVEFGESIKDVLIDVFTKGDLGAIVDAIESAVVEVKDVEGTYKGDDVSVDEMTVTVTKDEEGKELVEAVVSDIVIGDKVVVKDMTVTVDSGVTTVDAEDVHLDITFDDIDIEVVFDGDIVATVEEDSKSDRVIQSTVTVDKAEVTADGQKTIVDGTDTPASITIEAIYHSDKSEIDTVEAEIDSNGATVIVGDTVYEGFKGTYEKAPETDSSTTYTADTVVKTLDDGTTVTYKGVSKDVLFNAETMIMQKGDEKLVFDNVVSSSIDGTDWRAESFEIDVKEILEEGVTIVDGVVSNYYTGEVAVIDGKIVMFRLNDTVPTEGLSFHMKTETVNMTVNGVHYDVPCGANVVLSGSYEVNGVPVTDDVIVADKDLVIVKAKTVSEVIDKDGNVDLRDGEVVISKDDLEKVSADKIGFLGNNNTSVQMSKKDLETLAGDGSFTIDFGTKEYSSTDAGIQKILNAKGLSEKNKEKLKDATFFEFEADGATGEFNKALVTMPFELGDKDPVKLYAYKVNEKGVLKAVDCTYSHDGEKGYVTFEIDGEGTVAVTEKLNSEPTPTPSGDDDKVLYIAAAIFISVLVGAVLTIRHFKGKSE